MCVRFLWLWRAPENNSFREGIQVAREWQAHCGTAVVRECAYRKKPSPTVNLVKSLIPWLTPVPNVG